jgi:hypothetical protein
VNVIPLVITGMRYKLFFHIYSYLFLFFLSWQEHSLAVTGIVEFKCLGVTSEKVDSD